MSNLRDHAMAELEREKLFTEEGDFYGGMMGKSVMELMEVFIKQGHSGMSGSIVISIFTKLADFRALSPLTSDPAEWCEVGDNQWQNRRNSECFSSNGGLTYYSLSNRRKWVWKLPWALRKRLPNTLRYHMTTSVVAA